MVWLVVVVPSDQCLDPGIAPKKKTPPRWLVAVVRFQQATVQFGLAHIGMGQSTGFFWAGVVRSLNCNAVGRFSPHRLSFFFIATHLELPWYNFIIHK